MKKIAVLIGVVLLILAAIVVSKTISNSPGAHQKSSALEILPTEAIAHMSQAIQIKTETPNDAYEFDTDTFFTYRKNHLWF